MEKRYVVLASNNNDEYPELEFGPASLEEAKRYVRNKAEHTAEDIIAANNDMEDTNGIVVLDNPKFWNSDIIFQHSANAFNTSLENVKYGDKFLWSIREFKEEQ